ncbi:MAG: CotH kinase family protein [Pseudomonadota bacterium]
MIGVGLLWAGLLACHPIGIAIHPEDDSGQHDTTDSPTPDDSEPPEPVDTGTEHIPDAPEPSDAIFSGDQLPSFTIVVSVANADQLQAEYAGGEHEYVEATFQYHDRSYGPVGIRLKGENSFERFREKPSMKVDFNRFEPEGEFLGLKSLTLNNMDNDYTMMHERLAYRVYREAGVPAYRASHALVYVQEVDEGGAVVSDRFYGLYALLEDANKDFIQRWFEDGGGNLFEIWDSDFYDGYVPCPNAYGTAGCFQLEYGEDDRTRLQAVADALELEGQAGYDAAAPALDWDDFVSYWAAGAVVAQFDAYPYTNPGDDAHVYDDPTSGRLWFIPHGMDEAFYYPDSDITSANGIVGRRCKAYSPCFDAMKERTWEVWDAAEAWGWLALFDEVQDQIAPWVEADTNKPYSDEYVNYYQANMRTFISSRRNTLQRWVGAHP